MAILRWDYYQYYFDVFCETETSCSVALERTKGKILGCSDVVVGLTRLFRVGSESTDGLGRGYVGDFGNLEGFLPQNFKIVEWLMYNKTNIIAKMRHHCVVPSIPPKMTWNMLPMTVVEFLNACPVASIILDAASSRLPTTFSSRSSTPFQVSWIASIALIMELSPCATYSKVAPRALPIPITCRHPHDPFGGLLFPALWRSEKSSNIV